MIEIVSREPSIEEKIHTLADHYSKRSQWMKTKEEAEELLEELYMAANPMDDENMVNLSGNFWSEAADVIIMITQMVMQHGKEEEILRQINFKVERQLKRMEEEKLLLSGGLVRCKDKDDASERAKYHSDIGIKTILICEVDGEQGVWLKRASA